MENLVFTELVKRGVKPNRDLFYYKTRNDREVDFVVKKGSEITELVQVCYEAISSNVEQRETKALLEASGELGVEKMTVLTWDEKREVKKGGRSIRLIPLWEWLMEKG
ncbi:ATP-binding protein [Candidatus Gottesmanbacteria bacterium]|nr:ATP-binding protein [Candidatus Gottesmanbacteria bacterium]